MHFFPRLSQRHPDNVSMAILNGNNSLLSGTYKYSLCEYMNAFKLDQTNPLISLMLGITFVHMLVKSFLQENMHLWFRYVNLFYFLNRSRIFYFFGHSLDFLVILAIKSINSVIFCCFVIFLFSLRN